MLGDIPPIDVEPFAVLETTEGRELKVKLEPSIDDGRPPDALDDLDLTFVDAASSFTIRSIPQAHLRDLAEQLVDYLDEMEAAYMSRSEGSDNGEEV